MQLKKFNKRKVKISILTVLIVIAIIALFNFFVGLIYYDSPQEAFKGYLYKTELFRLEDSTLIDRAFLTLDYDNYKVIFIQSAPNAASIKFLKFKVSNGKYKCVGLGSASGFDYNFKVSIFNSGKIGNERMFYYLSETEVIKDVEVGGQPPDGVIELKYNGDNIMYFMYYKNLLDKNGAITIDGIEVPKGLKFRK